MPQNSILCLFQLCLTKMSQQIREQQFQFFPTSASCMQNKKVLKMAKWERGLMEMWAVVPKKASLVFSMLFITLMCISYNSNNTPVETNICNLSQSQCVWTTKMISVNKCSLYSLIFVSFYLELHFLE